MSTKDPTSKPDDHDHPILEVFNAENVVEDPEEVSDEPEEPVTDSPA